MRIIDAHHHLWDPARRAYPWLKPLPRIHRPYNLGDLRAHAEAVGVGQTVLVQTLPDVSETHELLTIAAQSAGLVTGVVGWLDVTTPDLHRRLDELRAAPGGEHLVGIRHQAQDEADPRWLQRPAVVDGLRALAHAGLVFDLLVLPEQLPAAISLVERVPDGRFVLDHAAKPPIRSGTLEPWARQLRQLAAHPSVTCKLSGLVTEADWGRWQVADLQPYADVVLEAFGPQRVMAGSDWPVCELAASYAQVWDTTTALISALPDVEQAEVLAGVAARTYRLP